MKGICPTQTVVLADGTSVRIRPIRPDDAARLQAFATRLSPRTIFLRTNMARPAALSDREAAYATQVDYHSSMALVGLAGTEPADQIIGVARYAGGHEAPGQAEVGIVVEDAYQQHGLGSQLLLRLAAYARDEGWSFLVGNIAANNQSVLSLLRHSGLPAEYVHAGRGEYQVIVPLRGDGAGRTLARRASDLVRPLRLHRNPLEGLARP